MRKLIVANILVLAGQPGIAGEYTSATAVGIYEDQMIKVRTISEHLTAGFGNDQGMKSQVGTGVTKNQERLGSDADVKKIDLGSDEKNDSVNTNLSFAQTVAYFHTLQLFYDQTRGDDTNAHAWGFGYDLWVIKDRLRLGLFYQKNIMSQQSKDFTDIDGKRVITPDRISGDNYRIDTTAYLQTTTILLANYSRTKRDDRPDAWALSLQIRQYVEDANAAFYLSYQRYENVGSLAANTEIGEVESDRYSLEWHQKFAKQYIAMFGYRMAKEIEKPRSYESGYRQDGSDYMYGSLRYRFAHSWTFRSNEVSAIYGRYLRNDGLSGYLMGLGLDLLF